MSDAHNLPVSRITNIGRKLIKCSFCVFFHIILELLITTFVVWFSSLHFLQESSVTGIHWPSDFLSFPEFIIVNRYKNHWGDQDVDGRIILRWIFRKWEEVVGTGWSWLRIGTGGGRL